MGLADLLNRADLKQLLSVTLVILVLKKYQVNKLFHRPIFI